jgi:hypothetical protein
MTALTAVPANAGTFTFEFGGGSPSWGYDSGYGGYRHHRHRHRLSTDEVRAMLRDDGYRRIRFIDDRGAVYQLRASRHGRDFFLVVSARSGEVISRQRI